MSKSMKYILYLVLVLYTFFYLLAGNNEGGKNLLNYFGIEFNLGLIGVAEKQTGDENETELNVSIRWHRKAYILQAINCNKLFLPNKLSLSSNGLYQYENLTAQYFAESKPELSFIRVLRI